MNRTTLHYGTQHTQVLDLWQRADHAPVVVLLHGGYWRQIYTKRLMHPLAKALAARGWAVANVEYRRVGLGGSGGWPATFDDVSAALDRLAGIDGLDLTRVVTCGHSAGGHLALWLAGPRTTTTAPTGPPHPVTVRAAVSLGGIPDLVAAARLGLGGGAVTALIGGAPDERPDAYALASPAALLPLGVPQVLVHGLDDTTVPPSLSADYAAFASSLGDDARYVPLEGESHMDMIKPGRPAAAQIVSVLDSYGAGG